MHCWVLNAMIWRNFCEKCGNYGLFLSQFFSQKFREINVYAKLSKLLNNWFHEFILVRGNFLFLHTLCYETIMCTYIRYSQINCKLIWRNFTLILYTVYVCGFVAKWIIYWHWKKFRQINSLVKKLFSRNFCHIYSCRQNY